MGVQVGGVYDFADQASGEHTNLGFGPTLALTYRLHFAEFARADLGCKVTLLLGLTGSLGRLRCGEHTSSFG